MTIRETATHYGLTTIQFRQEYASFLHSEGFDDDGREYQTLDAWMRRNRVQIADPTPWQKGDDYPA